MKQTINFNQFVDSFSEQRRNQFSYEGKRALFNYLEQLEKDLGKPIELDTVAFCCEYSEYADLKELQEDYPNIKSMNDLRDNTTVIEIENSEGFLIVQF